VGSRCFAAPVPFSLLLFYLLKIFTISFWK
jgi:hypothetical protein